MSYKELRESTKDSLELQYLLAMSEKNDEKKFKVLQNLMRYRLIPFDDERVSKRALKAFEKKIGSLSVADAYDYRKNDYRYMIADNIIGKEPAFVSIKVTSDAHWIKRRELQYIGDQMCEAKDVMFRGSRLVHQLAAEKAFTDMAVMYNKSEHKKLDTGKYKWKNGEYHIWAIRRDARYAWNTDNLGYFVSWFTDSNNVNVELVVDVEGMQEAYVDIIRTTDSIMADIKDAYNEIGVENVNINCLTSYSKIGKKQRLNSKVLLGYEEKMKELQDEADREALENEAYNRRTTIEALLVEKAEEAKHEAEKERLS